MASFSGISLKWGSLKSWNVSGWTTEQQKLLDDFVDTEEYIVENNSRSLSISSREKLVKFIESVPGSYHLSFYDKYVSQEEAINYVINYGKKG